MWNRINMQIVLPARYKTNDQFYWAEDEKGRDPESRAAVTRHFCQMCMCRFNFLREVFLYANAQKRSSKILPVSDCSCLWLCDENILGRNGIHRDRMEWLFWFSFIDVIWYVYELMSYSNIIKTFPALICLITCHQYSSSQTEKGKWTCL